MARARVAPTTPGYRCALIRSVLSMLQPAGTTDFPVYPSTSAYGQPLAVSTGGGYGVHAMNIGSGPLSGPAAAFRQPPPPSTGGGGMDMWHTPPVAPIPMTHFARDPYQMPVPQLQREYDMLRQEYETAIQKLNSTMNSIKTFWSPELKRERSIRKEEMSKLALLQEQLRLTSVENQASAAFLFPRPSVAETKQRPAANARRAADAIRHSPIVRRRKRRGRRGTRGPAGAGRAARRARSVSTTSD